MQQTRSAFRFYDYHPAQIDFYREVYNGLSQQPKSISSKFFYDERGSRLFDMICDTPEYYLARTELQILRNNAREIAHCIGAGCILIEPGSGNSRKVRELFEIIAPSAYLPMDISRAWLRRAAQSLSHAYPDIEVHAVCTDYTSTMELPRTLHGPHRVAFFPGSTIGNFSEGETVDFLARIAHMTGRRGGLLIGVDTKKPADILTAAYNDSAGLTAEFNLNVLQRINDELGADFDLSAFRHLAVYNEQQGRMEMYLVSQGEQTVRIGADEFHFAAGERIHTENSHKYTIEEFAALAAQAGLHPVNVWSDSAGLFSVHYYETND